MKLLLYLLIAETNKPESLKSISISIANELLTTSIIKNRDSVLLVLALLNQQLNRLT